MTNGESRFPLTVSLPHLIADGGDKHVRTLLHNLTTLADKIALLRKGFSAALEISPPQYLVLMHIAQHQGQTGQTVTEVANQLGVTLPHVTKETAILVEKGLIKRSQNPKDGRSVLLVTTPKSDNAIRGLSKHLIKTNDQLFSGLDVQTFRVLCDGVATVLKNATAERPW